MIAMVGMPGWTAYLDSHLCHEDSQGLRPCDRGKDCTKCESDEVFDDYVDWDYKNRVLH